MSSLRFTLVHFKEYLQDNRRGLDKHNTENFANQNFFWGRGRKYKNNVEINELIILKLGKYRNVGTLRTIMKISIVATIILRTVKFFTKTDTIRQLEM